MDDAIKNNIELRQNIIDLVSEIDADVDHAECFYDLEMLNYFCSNLEKMRNLAREYFISNKKELDE